MYEKSKAKLESLRNSTNAGSVKSNERPSDPVYKVVDNKVIGDGRYGGMSAYVIDNFVNYAVLFDGNILSLNSGEIIGDSKGNVYLSSRFEGKTYRIARLVAKYIHGARDDQKCLPKDWEWTNYAPENVVVVDAEVYKSIKHKFKAMNDRIAQLIAMDRRMLRRDLGLTVRHRKSSATRMAERMGRFEF